MTRSPLAPRGLLLTALAAAFACMLATPADAQDEAPPKPELTVVQLKFANAEEVARVIMSVFGKDATRVSADPRLNSLVISAPRSTAEAIKKLVETLDREGGAEPVRQIKIFTLRHIRPDRNLQELLRLAAQNLTVGIDERTNSVIAMGTTHDLEVLAALVTRLDVEPPPPDPAEKEEMRVRVVWLVTGLARKDPAPPPADLAPVLRELEKIGVTDLGLAAQVVISTGMENRFTVQGSAALDDPCVLNISGIVSRAERIQPPEDPRVRGFGGARDRDRGPPPPVTVRAPADGRLPRMQITISAVSTRQPQAELAHLETTIAAPLGHSVVLGVTPIESKTSVFVVQFLPKSADEPKGKKD
ncbi:MAG TPA: secretin N-terminal domain-containing protein [Gemmataceae bacterium]